MIVGREKKTVIVQLDGRLKEFIGGSNATKC